MIMVNAVDGNGNLCRDCPRATVDSNGILRDQVDPRDTPAGGRTVNYIRQSVARELMSLRPNSLKAPIFHILLLSFEAYYLPHHILYAHGMECPDEGIRITNNVHIESTQRSPDVQHSTSTTVPIGEVIQTEIIV
jgi:hypothetical protein